MVFLPAGGQLARHGADAAIPAASRGRLPAVASRALPNAMGSTLPPAQETIPTMKTLPESILQAWGKRVGPCVLATTSAEGTPNAVYIGTAHHYEGGFVIANYHFHKTIANLLANPAASLLFFTGEYAYQLKGTVTFHCEGPVLETALATVEKMGKPPVQSAALFTVKGAFCGAEQIL